ncbi:MAG: tetratricopeptide repeat protein, partial [Thermodesulfobacteriota bacterium]|nr:tetratricopeptide repeat protein [Thermodesulfobacteriota bacterium]
MKVRQFMGYCAIFAVALIAACASQEESKMKFFNKGEALYEKGKYLQASLEFKNALQIDPKFAKAYYELGQCEYRLKNFKRAFNYTSKAVELDPELLEGQVFLGRILLLARQTDKTSEKVEIVLNKEPE